MKKLVVLVALGTAFLSIGGSMSFAHDIDNLPVYSVESSSRLTVERYFFKSTPPRKHKGLSLINTEKLKNGYWGYYV